MSRSRRKTPKFGITTSRTEKDYKRQANKASRRATRTAVAKDREPPATKEHGNPWSGPKDGKRYWRDADDRDMRK